MRVSNMLAHSFSMANVTAQSYEEEAALGGVCRLSFVLCISSMTEA